MKPPLAATLSIVSLMAPAYALARPAPPKTVELPGSSLERVKGRLEQVRADPERLRLHAYLEELSSSPIETLTAGPGGLRFESTVDVYGVSGGGLDVAARRMLAGAELRYGPAPGAPPTRAELQEHRPHPAASANLEPLVQWLLSKARERAQR